MFYIDVGDNSGQVFYKNFEKKLNKLLARSISDELLTKIVNTDLKSTGSNDYAYLTYVNNETGDVVQDHEMFMQGITATVNKALAEKILERAKYYCPVDTGFLRESGRIDIDNNGICRIYFDCPYAWYVHEFWWREHKEPTRDHFLTRAIEEVTNEVFGG